MTTPIDQKTNRGRGGSRLDGGEGRRVKLHTGTLRGRATLVVDDDPERLEFFRERLPGCAVATSYDEALAALRRRRFGTVFLDFDLVGSRSGGEVAYWMTRRLARARRPRVIVQSTNGRGALAIEVTLRSAGFEVEAQPVPPAILERTDDE